MEGVEEPFGVDSNIVGCNNIRVNPTDGDFNYNSPQEDDDVVDSDFSIDENDEVKSDPEDDESSRKKPKRGDGVQTKAYKV